MINVLLLTPQLPYPPHQGTSLRNYHIIRGLAADCKVSLLSFLDPEQTAVPEKIAPLLALCKTVQTVPTPQRSTARRLQQMLTTRRPDMAHRLFSAAFTAKLVEMLKEEAFDIVQIEGIEMARYLPAIRQVSPESKIVFDAHNAETELQRRNFLTDLRHPRRWVAAGYSMAQVRRLRRFEGWVCQQADWVTAVSDIDQTALAKLAQGQTPISVIPNSIDVQAFAIEAAAAIPNDILFSGKMDYRPNVDAVLWFTEKVWPRIVQERPSTTFFVVGQKPHARLALLHGQTGIHLTGRVEQVAPYIAGAGVVVLPFRIGSGTRLKLIEAMAAGKAVVSTAVGAEGFPVQHQHELILAEGEGEMAAAVLTLLENQAERSRLGRVARRFAQNYDWRVVVPKFLEIYRDL